MVVTAVNKVQQVKDRLSHPVIDNDGHMIEFLPYVVDILTDIAGPTVAKRYTDYMMPTDRGLSASTRRAQRIPRSSFWPFPAANSLDRATAMLPGLLYERMPEMGIDFSVILPSMGLDSGVFEDEELRRASSRAFNVYFSSILADYSDRMTPVAMIPAYTPEEAIAELDYAVHELGFRAAMVAHNVWRETKIASGETIRWLDYLAHDSLYDYDPLWSRFRELGVTPFFHHAAARMDSHKSTTNMVFNHMAAFEFAQQTMCRAVVIGGTAKRFTDLRFAFLEGGVSWACQLYSYIRNYWSKRNGRTVRQYDPARIDMSFMREMFGRYARGPLAERRDRLEERFFNRYTSLEDNADLLDDWAESGIADESDIAALFRDQFFFGCEADDRGVARAFDADSNFGLKVNATMSSDISHWDVPDMSGVLLEAWELVEDGLITEDDFRLYSCHNVARMLTHTRPDFFKGTVVEEYVDSQIPRP